MDERQQRVDLVDFLSSVAKPGCRVDAVADDTNLIRDGFIDSFAVIQIISYLEQRHDVNLHALGIDPADLGSVGGMLMAIARASE